MNNRGRSQLAYRCPSCGYATVGFLGGLSAVSDMLRLKCQCGESALDIKRQKDGKIHLSAPCVYCKTNHGFLLSSEVVGRSELTKLPCPFAGMGIAFLGAEEDIAPALDQSAEELSMVMASFEAKELSDIQPMDEDEEVFQDPGVYDAINFLVADLKAEDKVLCHCTRKGEGESAKISLRFTSDGIRVVCDTCGACKDIHARSSSAAEEYMSLDLLELR